MDPTTYAVIAAAVLLGSVVQSAVGLGVGLVAAPVTALLEPALMPGALLMVAVLMPCLTLVFDHHDIDWSGLLWSLPARLPGTLVGVWVVTTLTARELGIAIGVVVLVAVAVTWRAIMVPVNRGDALGGRVRQRHHRYGDVDRRAADRDRLPAPAGPRDPDDDGRLLPRRRRPVPRRPPRQRRPDQRPGRRRGRAAAVPRGGCRPRRRRPGARSRRTSSVRRCCWSARPRPLSCSCGP